MEHAADAHATDDLGCSTDVVALWMGEDERGERADSHADKLLRRVSLGRPLVDEDSGARRLQQDRVALADIEERHAQPARRRTNWIGASEPGGRDDDGDAAD